MNEEQGSKAGLESIISRLGKSERVMKMNLIKNVEGPNGEGNTSSKPVKIV